MTREEWDAKQNASKKQFKYMSDGEAGKVKKVEVTEEEKEPVKDGETKEPISPELKQNWNRFLDWLDVKGVRGDASLDKGDLGNKYFRQYLKETPNSGLSEESLPLIRQGYMEMRNQGLEDYKSGKMGFEKGTTPENFMKYIVLNESTEHPNYVGQHLTRTRFPGAKVRLLDKGKVVGEVSTSQFQGSGRNALENLGKKLQ